MKSNIISKKPKRILVFSPTKKLIAIFQSLTTASNAFATSPSNIHFACTGKSISSSNLYFRHLDDDIVVSQDDLGSLKLEEYDKLCGVTRTYYKTKAFSRKGSKYNKLPKITTNEN